MPWYAYIDDANGALLSLSQIQFTVASGISVVQLSIDPTDPQWMYDQAQRLFVARPAKVIIDRLQDMLTDPNYADFVTVWNNLTAARKTLLRNMLIRLLGGKRFRAAGETVELE